MLPKKILYIVAHRLNRSPGQRFRFEQYLAYLKQNGFEYEISNFLNEKDDKIFYSKGNYILKFWILIKSMLQRLNDVRRANKFGVVFIYRDAIMIRTTVFEWLFHLSKAKVIFDFDDAIWFTEVSEGNANLGWLKNPDKTKRIIELSDMVFAGNKYLADYSLNFNKNVKVVPTTIDTDYFIRRKEIKSEQLSTINEQRICIGWTGSFTTVKHLMLAESFLRKIKDKYNDRVCFKMISDIPLPNDELGFEFCKWSSTTEIEDLSSIDIGIMPLPDDKWSRGKCGFKGLQYMALEIPSVMSPVGVNNEIIENGVNGFLPKSEDEWVEVLSRLIESEELRKSIGKMGRKTIVERYSFHSLKDTYLSYFNELVK